MCSSFVFEKCGCPPSLCHALFPPPLSKINLCVLWASLKFSSFVVLDSASNIIEVVLSGCRGNAKRCDLYLFSKLYLLLRTHLQVVHTEAALWSDFLLDFKQKEKFPCDKVRIEPPTMLLLVLQDGIVVWNGALQTTSQRQIIEGTFGIGRVAKSIFTIWKTLVSDDLEWPAPSIILHLTSHG